MTKDVSCGSPGTNVAAAAEIMWAKNCGSLPIVEDGGHVVGMITDRDLFIALGTQNRRLPTYLWVK
jgi:CBS domain-containing protein